MNCYEEFANAVTMLPPPFILYYYATTPSAWILVAAVAAQIPFSMSYHVRMAWERYCEIERCSVDNHWRRMDQTTQHLSQLIVTWALSGDLCYTAVVAAVHCVACGCLWYPATSNDRRRWQPLALGVLLYVKPMGCSLELGAALAPMLIGGTVAFVPFCKQPYGHAVFHVCTWAHAVVLGHWASTHT